MSTGTRNDGGGLIPRSTPEYLDVTVIKDKLNLLNSVSQPQQTRRPSCGFTQIGDILCEVVKEVHRRTQLRPRLEVEIGRPLSDEEFIELAEKRGMRI